MFCKECGKEVNEKAVICTSCGCSMKKSESSKSGKSKTTALLLCLFLGSLGAHRFFVGKTGSGILMLFTLGGFGIWSLIDLIALIMGNFTDSDGKKLS